MPQKPKAFKTLSAFRIWLKKHHASEKELTIRLFKVHATNLGIGYKDALDEALCFGWIDGVRRALDADSFTQRFTPRKPKSYWSKVNIKRAQELEAENRMTAAGLAAFHGRDAAMQARYSFESASRELDAASKKLFRSKPAAWEYYMSRAPWYRRTTTFWVTSAKRAETRAKRLGMLIDCCALGKPIPGLERSK